MTRNSRLIILGFGGRACSGKTYAAGEVIKRAAKRGLNGMVLSFAAPLKQALNTQSLDALLDRAGIGDNEIDVQRFYSMDRRSALQQFGTDVIRAAKPNFWVEFMLDKLNAVYKLALKEFGQTVVTIDDIRFVNELVGLDAWSAGAGVPFKSYYISTLPEVRRERGCANVDASHPSEISISSARFDVVTDVIHPDTWLDDMVGGV